MTASLEQSLHNVDLIAASRRAATHCKYGHEFTPANTYWRKDNGRRACRQCVADRAWYYQHGLRWAR